MSEDSFIKAAAAELEAAERFRIEQATLWLMRLQEDVAVEEDSAFREWFSEPQNRDACQEVEAAWRCVDQYAATRELLALREAALASVRRFGRPPWYIHPTVHRAIAATLVLAVVSSFCLYFYLTAPVRYVTAIGERREVTLEDGSRLTLDADTEVSAQYSRSSRDLRLYRGRARFQVMHNATRPFKVKVNTETVLAVGTDFDVEGLEKKTIVTLLSGKVTVGDSADSRAPSAPSRVIALEAGERLIADPAGPFVVKHVDLETAKAWESARLEFYDEPLSQAVARVNRYTTSQLFTDRSVADLRISGVFNAGDVNSFIEALTSYFPVDVLSQDNHLILRSRTTK